MAISPGEESAVDDFAVHLFRALGYTGRAVARTTRTRKDLPFLVCGEERHAKADVSTVLIQSLSSLQMQSPPSTTTISRAFKLSVYLPFKTRLSPAPRRHLPKIKGLNKQL